MVLTNNIVVKSFQLNIQIRQGMSFDDDESFSYDYDSLNNHSFETETQFLKDKLIETHEKLMRQLKKSKELEDKMMKMEKRTQNLEEENEQIHHKFTSLQRKNHFDKSESEKNRILEMKLEEQQRKNQMIKTDLESMRNKMLETIMQKNELEDELSMKEDLIATLNQKANSMVTEIRQKNKDIKYIESEVQAYKRKYQSVHESCDRIENQLHQLKRQNKDYYEKAVEAQTQLRGERDKNSKLMSEIRNIQAQHKHTVNKLQEIESQCDSLKDEIYWLQNNEKNETKNAHEQLEKLTNELNTMSAMYKQKQKELDKARRKPLQTLQRRKKNFENTKEFVYRLQSQQNNKRGYKMNTEDRENSYSPQNKRYKQEKDAYISMISEIGDMETILTNCNTEKKKIIHEIDKIQLTKVKTKDMIHRRRRLEDDLSYQEDKIRKVKEEMRKIKAM